MYVLNRSNRSKAGKKITPVNSKHSQEFLFGTVSAPLVLFFNYKFICISSIDNCFTVSNLIILRTILFLEYRKTPETQGFWGILRLDTTLSCDNKSIFRLYYSMIVATRPDPTVRPPSRYFNPVLPYIFYGFLSKIQ